MSDISQKLFRIAKLPLEDMRTELLEFAALQQRAERRRETSRRTTQRWRDRHGDCHSECHGDTNGSVTVTVTESACILPSNTLPIGISKKDKLQASSQAPKPKVVRGTRLDPAWQPSSDDYQFALDAGLSDTQIGTEAASFVDYWIGVPGAKGTKLNWSATWRNRIRMVAAKYTNKTNGISAKPLTFYQQQIAKRNEQLDRLKAFASGCENSPQISRQLGSPNHQHFPSHPDHGPIFGSYGKPLL